MKKTPLDAGAVPAERPAPDPRAEPAPEDDEVQEVPAPRKMVWNDERKTMLMRQITSMGVSSFLTCRSNN